MTYPAANALVRRMVNCGIVREFTGQSRNRQFISRQYMRLFTEGDGKM